MTAAASYGPSGTRKHGDAVIWCLSILALLLSGVVMAEPRIVSQESSVIKGRRGIQYDSVLYRIEVPEKRVNPNSNAIQLAVLQIKSAQSSSGSPTFCLAGGPGDSSIDMARRAIFADPALLEYGDVIGVDQRGIGLSTPLLIFDDIEYTIPYEVPGEPSSLLKIVEAAHAEAYKRVLSLDIDPSGYNTEESADDIEDVRKLLGYERIRIVGGSYGSHLAFSIVKRHGKFVERVVIQSPEGPEHTYKRPGQIQDGLELLAQKVRENAELSEQIPDLNGVINTILQRLERQPVHISVQADSSAEEQTIGISKFDVQRWIAGSLGRVGTARLIPLTCYEMLHGDFSQIGLAYHRSRGVRRGVHAMANLVDTASWASESRFARIREEAKNTILGDTVDFPSYQLASSWGRHFLDDVFRSPLVSDTPFLFLVGDLDARTPPSNALEIMEGLPNGHLFIVENFAHDFSLLALRKTRDLVHRFFDGEPIVETKVVRSPVRFKKPDPEGNS